MIVQNVTLLILSIEVFAGFGWDLSLLWNSQCQIYQVYLYLISNDQCTNKNLIINKNLIVELLIEFISAHTFSFIKFY